MVTDICISMVSKRVLRALFAAVLCLSGAGVAYGYASESSSGTFESHIAGGTVDGSERVAPPRNDVTVVATDSNSWRGEASEGPRARAELVAGVLLAWTGTEVTWRWRG